MSNPNYIDQITLDGVTRVIRDTTLESKSPEEGGTALSLVTTGEKYAWSTTGGGGTVTAVKVNGTSYAPTEGVVDIGTAASDVQINGTSILSSGIANIPLTSDNDLGAVMTNASLGISASSGIIRVNKATDAQIKSGDNTYRPVVTSNQHQAVFYGLAKAAGDTSQASSENAVGTYTDGAKTAIRTMISAGTYSLPSGGIPASDLASGVIPTLTDLIDDTAGNGTTNKTWSADKIYDQLDLKAPKANPVFTGSISLGRKSGVSSGSNSFAVGDDVTATGDYSHAEGSGTNALGGSAHAEGFSTTASSSYSHAEGALSTASKTAAHAEGYGTTASGLYSHAEGRNSTASGSCSHAEGNATTAKHYAQHVFGEYNIDDSSTASTSERGTYVEIVGNGTTTEKSNARTLDWSGNENLAGDLKIYAGTNNEVSISGLKTSVDQKLNSSLKGANNGLAELDSTGKVPASQLPSYVDDVLEYDSTSSFPSTGETGKIYVAKDTNKTYRWSGSDYVEISPSLALGETSSTAYRGDRGATAYSHATDSSRLTTAQTSGLYKIATTAEGHVASVTAVQKSDITGLGIPGSIPVTDIQINSTSIVSNGVANIPLASASNYGVGKTSVSRGITVNDSYYTIAKASSTEIKDGSSDYKPIVPSKQHESIYYGLSKLAGVDLALETVTVGTYPETSQTAIRTLIGAGTYSKPSTGIPASDLASGVIPSVPVTDVQVNGTSVLSSGVANIPHAATGVFGAVKLGYTETGLYEDSTNHDLRIAAATDAVIKSGNQNYRPIVPTQQHKAIYYGLSKLAGVDLANETVTVGEYPSDSQSAIRTMIGAGTYNKPSGGIPSTDLADSYIAEPSSEGTNGQVLTTDGNGGRSWTDKPSVPVTDVQVNGTSVLSQGVANIPVGSSSNLGVVKSESGYGIFINSTTGRLYTDKATSSHVKAGTDQFRPIVPYNQNESVFYGLAKAAGVDLANETVTTGTYPANAQSAICTMIGAGTYSKPSGGIPASDIASGVIPTLTDLIDDTAGNGTTNKVWSADKSYDELNLKAPKANPVFTGSISLGRKANTTVGSSSIAIGLDAEATASYATAIGVSTKATQIGAVAFGSGTASGLSSFAEGTGTATGTGSHAEGYGTISSSAGSHAEGFGSTASNSGSHAEGFYTVSSGIGSHASGRYTTSCCAGQLVGGNYNVSDTTYTDWAANTSYSVGDKVSYNGIGYACKIAHTSSSSFDSSKWDILTSNGTSGFIIGNGTDADHRSNALTLTWTGDLHLDGDVYVNANADGTGGSKLVTESFVTTRVPTPPTTDGTYYLKCVVSSGTPSYSWATLPVANGVSF